MSNIKRFAAQKLFCHCLYLEKGFCQVQYILREPYTKCPEDTILNWDQKPQQLNREAKGKPNKERTSKAKMESDGSHKTSDNSILKEEDNMLPHCNQFMVTPPL